MNSSSQYKQETMAIEDAGLLHVIALSIASYTLVRHCAGMPEEMCKEGLTIIQNARQDRPSGIPPRIQLGMAVDKATKAAYEIETKVSFSDLPIELQQCCWKEARESLRFSLHQTFKTLPRAMIRALGEILRLDTAEKIFSQCGLHMTQTIAEAKALVACSNDVMFTTNEGLHHILTSIPPTSYNPTISSYGSAFANVVADDMKKKYIPLLLAYRLLVDLNSIEENVLPRKTIIELTESLITFANHKCSENDPWSLLSNPEVISAFKVGRALKDHHTIDENTRARIIKKLSRKRWDGNQDELQSMLLQTGAITLPKTTVAAPTTAETRSTEAETISRRQRIRGSIEEYFASRPQETPDDAKDEIKQLTRRLDKLCINLALSTVDETIAAIQHGKNPFLLEEELLELHAQRKSENNEVETNELSTPTAMMTRRNHEPSNKIAVRYSDEFIEELEAFKLAHGNLVGPLLARLERISRGELGDHKRVRDTSYIISFRIHTKGGIRIYGSRIGNEITLHKIRMKQTQEQKDFDELRILDAALAQQLKR